MKNTGVYGNIIMMPCQAEVKFDIDIFPDRYYRLRPPEGDDKRKEIIVAGGRIPQAIAERGWCGKRIRLEEVDIN